MEISRSKQVLRVRIVYLLQKLSAFLKTSKNRLPSQISEFQFVRINSQFQIVFPVSFPNFKEKRYNLKGICNHFVIDVIINDEVALKSLSYDMQSPVQNVSVIDHLDTLLVTYAGD